MFKKRLTIIFLSFLMIISFYSCDHENGAEKLIYEVKSQDSSKISYLIGGIHKIPKRIFNSRDTKIFIKYINKCNSLVLEANTDSSQLYFEKFKNEFDIKNNREILTEEELGFLTAFLKDTLKFTQERIEEILNNDPITTGSILEKEYLKEDYFNMDSYLRSYAERKGKDVNFLDSPERFYYYLCQYSLLQYKDSWFKNDSLKSLYSSELMNIFENYTNDIFTDHDTITYASNQNLIEQRDHEWISRITELIEEENCVILMGKGHLKDIIGLLTENKYVVSPAHN